MYFQYFGKKKVDEEGWRALHKEDASRFKVGQCNQKLMSRHVITEEDKKPEILLEADDIRNFEGLERNEKEKTDDVKPTVRIIIKAKAKETPVDKEEEDAKPVKKLKTKALVDYSDSEEN